MKKEYWLRGGVVGALFSFITGFLVILSFSGFLYLPFEVNILNIFHPIILWGGTACAYGVMGMDNPSDFFVYSWLIGCSGVALLVSTLAWFLIGAVIGEIVDKLRKIFSK